MNYLINQNKTIPNIPLLEKLGWDNSKAGTVDECWSKNITIQDLNGDRFSYELRLTQYENLFLVFISHQWIGRALTDTELNRLERALLELK